MAKENSVLNSRIISLSILGLVGLSILFLLLMYGWISLNTSPGDPNYVLEEPLRQFFIGAMIAVFISSLPLNQYFRKNRKNARVFLFLGLIMNLVGLIGILFVLPTFGTLAHSGGLTPDFGHTLTYDNLTGGLWLFLIFSGTIFYINAHLTIPKTEKNPISKVLPFVLGSSVFYASGAVYDAISTIVEAGNLKEKFLFSLIIGLIAGVGVQVLSNLRSKSRSGK